MDADGLWKRALCCPCPTVSHADPSAAMAFPVPPTVQLSGEEPGHRGCSQCDKLPAWSSLENEVSVCLCVCVLGKVMFRALRRNM